jgi:hypothetical protein
MKGVRIDFVFMPEAFGRFSSPKPNFVAGLI